MKRISKPARPTIFTSPIIEEAFNQHSSGRKYTKSTVETYVGDVSRVIEALLACASDDDIEAAMALTGFSDTQSLGGVKIIRAEIARRRSL